MGAGGVRFSQASAPAIGRLHRYTPCKFQSVTRQRNREECKLAASAALLSSSPQDHLLALATLSITLSPKEQLQIAVARVLWMGDAWTSLKGDGSINTVLAAQELNLCVYNSSTLEVERYTEGRKLSRGFQTACCTQHQNKSVSNKVEDKHGHLRLTSERRTAGCGTDTSIFIR